MELKQGQRLKVKTFEEIPLHFVEEMEKYMGKIVAFREREKDGDIQIFEDMESWSWKESDFEVVFDTWRDVAYEIEKYCNNRCSECVGCILNDGTGCYGTLFRKKDYKTLAEKFRKIYGMDVYVLEDQKEEREEKEMETKFKVGDKVRLKKGLIANKHYGALGLTEPIWQEKKEIVIPDDCKDVLKHISEDFRWIAKDENGRVFIYKEKPEKQRNCVWYSSENRRFDDILKHLDFNWLSWEDEEPVNFREVLKGE